MYWLINQLNGCQLEGHIHTSQAGFPQLAIHQSEEQAHVLLSTLQEEASLA
jgi:hypothetical protein